MRLTPLERKYTILGPENVGSMEDDTKAMNLKQADSEVTQSDKYVL